MERQIVERAKRGDHAAYAALVRQLGPKLYGIALRVTGNAALADDAVQEGLILAWRDLPSLRDPDRFEAWMARIVLRRCYRELQRQPRGTGALDATEEHLAGHDHGSGMEDRDEIESAMRKLSPQHRAVLVLRYYADLEPIEIAEVLAAPVGTIRSRLYYALAAMRAALAADARRRPSAGEAGR